MPPKAARQIALAALSAAALCLPSFAQDASPNTEFRITKIEPAFQPTPDYSGAGYSKKSRGKPSEWLEIEVTFEWAGPKNPDPADPKAKYTDDVAVNYFVLLNNKSPLYPKPVLLTGTVNLAKVGPAPLKEARSVMFVSPKDLDILFGGRVPGTPSAAVAGIGVSISSGGKVVAAHTTKGSMDPRNPTQGWWDLPSADTDLLKVPGVLLDKTQTPFAPLAWDYHELVKPKQ